MMLPTLIADGYRATTFDYEAAGSLEQWIEVFEASIPTFMHHCLSDAALPTEQQRREASEAFERDFRKELQSLRSSSSSHGGQPAAHASCVLLCQIRERCLRGAGFCDIFKKVKDEENQQALGHLPSVLLSIDGQEGAAARMGLALRGVFAGNVFDLGAATSAELYEKNGASASFASTREQLLSRPWAVDDYDAILARVADPTKKPYKKVIMFVDNAGSDVLLGMLPLSREFIKTGAEVLLAANELPSCNDIIAEELQHLLDVVATMDDLLRQAIAGGRLRVVSSGNDLPVIDLMHVSEELARVSADADLIVLEGMGRAIETNLFAKFTCDSMKLGMIKHQPVADALNGRLYDCVCKFDEAA